MCSANADNLLFLKDPQKLALKGKADISYFIKEDRSAVRFLKKPLFPALCSTGKCPLLIPEQLALKEVLCNGRTVDSDKLFSAPLTCIVYCMSKQLFPCSALSP